MYAVLRLNSFDPAKLAVSADLLEEFDKIHAAQPGYVGSVVVELGAGRRFALNLWESEQHKCGGFAGPRAGSRTVARSAHGRPLTADRGRASALFRSNSGRERLACSGIDLVGQVCCCCVAAPSRTSDGDWVDQGCPSAMIAP